MKTRTILALFAALLWVSACSDNGVTNPLSFESDQIESPGTIPSTVFKQLFAGQIVYAPKWTYYECDSGGVNVATGGEDLFGRCQVWNEKGLTYTLEVQGPHRFFLSETSMVQITNPVGVFYQGEDEGRWVKVTGDIIVTCNAMKVTGNGSAGLSTSARMDIHSGRSEN